MVVHTGFEEENAALRLTELVRARPVRRYVGTRQEFEFDPDMAERLREALMLT